MRNVIWLVLLFGVAVLTASTLGTNDGLATFYWRAWRIDVSLNLFNFTLQEKQLVGSLFGSANPRRDIPHLLRLYQEGKLKLDELITRTYPLKDINKGYQDMRDGINVRGMLIY